MSGFTLAEMVLTLVVIGGVAATTIPAVIANTQDQEREVQLKKFVGDFQSALQLLMVDYNCIGDLSCTGIFKSETGDESYAKDNRFYTALGKHMKILRYCGTEKDCGPSFNASRPAIMFVSGAAISLDYVYNNCSASKKVIDDDPDDTRVPTDRIFLCANMNVDINGYKKPNKWIYDKKTGRLPDHFYLVITKQGHVLPRPDPDTMGYGAFAALTR